LRLWEAGANCAGMSNSQRLALDRRLTTLRLLGDGGVWRAIAFVVRCSGAATLAYLTATLVGLPHPVWATISALVVSQEKLHDTQGSLKGRILGTFIGIGAGITANALGSHLALGLSVQIAVSAGLCAAIARQYPAVRVCMWTGPIVLLTAEPSTAIITAAFFRGSEIMIGVLFGAALHWATEVTVLRTLHRAGDTGLE
jgi:uncharacterized membrane protein YgaE (UPF0421/DUF939 family)